MGPYINPDNGGGLRVGYVVDEQERGKAPLNASLPLLQHADLDGKIVLLRVDHNVVKKGKICLILTSFFIHGEFERSEISVDF